MKQFLLFISVLLLPLMILGQGAATPTLAFDDPSSYWFELDQDFTNGGSDWDVLNGTTFKIGMNESISYNNIVPVLYSQQTYDVKWNGCDPSSGSYEEWYIIVVPSNQIVNINFLCSGVGPNDGAFKTLEFFTFNSGSDLLNINGCVSPTTGPGSVFGSPFKTTSPLGSESLLLSSTNINGYKYLALRIGNNVQLPLVGVYNQYSISISTDNSICDNAIHVPITDGTKDPFFGDTDKAGVLLNSPPSEVGKAFPFYGADDVNSSSTGLGNWFTANSLAAENIYGALCGSAINPQLMIYTQCPVDAADEYIGGENQNVDEGTSPVFDAAWNRDICITGGNDPNWPVIKFPAAIDDYFFYIYSSDGVDGAFDFYLLNNEGGGILPVEWISFLGKAEGNKNRIEWITGSEQQNDYFSIEKSKDGENYTELAKVEGAGNSAFENDYSIIDPFPYPLTYYRISQVDWDGTIHNGPQTVVENNNAITNFKVVSNPVETNSIRLSYYITKDENIQIELYSLNGVTVYSEKNFLSKDKSELNIPITNLNKGMYLLSIKTAYTNYTQKIIISNNQ